MLPQRAGARDTAGAGSTVWSGDQPPQSRHHHSFGHCFTLFTEFFAPFDRSTCALSVPVAILRRGRFPTAEVFTLYYQTELLQWSGVVGPRPFSHPPQGHAGTGLSPCLAWPPFQAKISIPGGEKPEPRWPRRPRVPTCHNTVRFCGVVRRTCRWFRGGQDWEAASGAPTKAITVVFDSSAE